MPGAVLGYVEDCFVSQSPGNIPYLNKSIWAVQSLEGTGLMHSRAAWLSWTAVVLPSAVHCFPGIAASRCRFSSHAKGRDCVVQMYPSVSLVPTQAW